MKNCWDLWHLGNKQHCQRVYLPQIHSHTVLSVHDKRFIFIMMQDEILSNKTVEKVHYS